MGDLAADAIEIASKPQAKEYGRAAVDAIRTIASDKPTMDKLTAVVKLSVNVLSDISDELEFGSQALDAAQSFFGASEALAAVSQIVPVVAGAIPIIGMFVSAYSSAISQINAMDQMRLEEQSARCLDQLYLPVVGRGSGGVTRPADVFVFSNGKSTSVGDALRVITETDPVVGYSGNVTVHASDLARQVLKSSSIGIPAHVRAQFTKLRKALTAAAFAPEANGGENLWPVYNDLLYQQYKLGRLGPSKTYNNRFILPYADFLWSYDDLRNKTSLSDAEALGVAQLVLSDTNQRGRFPPMPRPGSAAAWDTGGVSCARFDMRPLMGAVALIPQWGFTIHPINQRDRDALAAVTSTAQKQAIETARLLTAADDVGVGIELRQMKFGASEPLPTAVLFMAGASALAGALAYRKHRYGRAL